jgi:hypothetical protein
MHISKSSCLTLKVFVPHIAAAVVSGNFSCRFGSSISVGKSEGVKNSRTFEAIWTYDIVVSTRARDHDIHSGGLTLSTLKMQPGP